jgi:C4-dicarboxylate-specific signal transduction histidine kinase
MLSLILTTVSWLVPVDERVWLAAVLALTALVGVVWQQSRTRARRRWLAAQDAYAQREIEQERRRNTLKRMQTLCTALGLPSGGQDHMMARRLAI